MDLLFILLISNKFTAPATVQGGIEMWVGGGSAVRKINCTGPWKFATIPLYNPLKPPVGAHVHKTTYGPLINTDLYVMLLMRANPLQEQVGEGWALEIEQSGDVKKLGFPGPNPLPLAQVMDLPASKALHTGGYQSEVHG
jgi:hypothetical protein